MNDFIVDDYNVTIAILPAKSGGWSAMVHGRGSPHSPLYSFHPYDPAAALTEVLNLACDYELPGVSRSKRK